MILTSGATGITLLSRLCTSAPYSADYQYIHKRDIQPGDKDKFVATTYFLVIVHGEHPPMVVDCHIEVGYTHTGGMPISMHTFCLSSRRATARIHPNGEIEYRTDPLWFTPYMRRETVEW